MRLYTTYLLKNIALPTLFITMALTCVAWLSQSLRFVDMIVNQGLPLSTFLYFVMLLLPSLLGMVIPIAIFCATIYVYNKLLYESELLVLKAAGISLVGLAKPAIILGSLIMLFSYLISLYLLPVSYREFKDLQFYLRDNYASTFLREGVFNNPVRGLSVYIKEKQSDDVLTGVLVHDNRDTLKPVTMMAESGIIETGEDGIKFLMKNASRQQIDRETGEVNILYFDSYPVDVSFYAGQDYARGRKKDEMFLPELFSPEESLSDSAKSKLIAEGHERLTWPINSLALPLIVIAILLSKDFNRRGQSKQIITAVAAGLLFILLQLAFKSFAAKGSMIFIGMMYLLPVFAILWSFKKLYFNRRKTVKSQIVGGEE